MRAFEKGEIKMNIDIKNNAKELLFEDFACGDIFVYNNEVFIILTDEIFDSGPRSRYNAVNLETGEPTYFSPNTKVICPNDYDLTVEL